MNDNIYNDENIAKYFANELDDKKLEMMEDQLLNNRDKDKQIRDFSRLWKKSAELGKYDNINIEKDWQKVRLRMGFKTKSKKISFKTYFLRVAAILILAFGMAWLFNQLINKVPGDQTNDYYTISANDEKKEITLPDNSIILLNKGANLVYNTNFSIDNRDVILEGEAFFEVNKDQNLPFRVFIGSSTVEVLGTSFNIKNLNNDIRVSVISGKVAFYETDRKDNRVDLIKNEESQYNKKSHKFDAKQKMNPNNLAWRNGIFIFNGEPLKDVFGCIGEYFNLKLEWKITHAIDETIPNLEIPVSSVEEILESLDDAIVEPYSYKIKDGSLIISD